MNEDLSYLCLVSMKSTGYRCKGIFMDIYKGVAKVVVKVYLYVFIEV